MAIKSKQYCRDSDNGQIERKKRTQHSGDYIKHGSYISALRTECRAKESRLTLLSIGYLRISIK